MKRPGPNEIQKLGTVVTILQSASKELRHLQTSLTRLEGAQMRETAREIDKKIKDLNATLNHWGG